MDRRIVFSIIILICLAFTACDPSLVEDVQLKIRDDQIAAGIIPSFRIVYSGNGSALGEVPVDDNLYTEGELAVIAENSNGLIKHGCSFGGWNTEADGSGTTYKEGDSLTIGTEDVRLYALWLPNLYSITFDKNDEAAAGSMPVQKITFCTTGNLIECSFGKPDWTFVGWAIIPSGDVVYRDEASLTMGSSDITLYAKWIEGYSITFDKNDPAATGEMDMQIIGKGENAPLTACEFTKTGWSFDGWAKTVSGDVQFTDQDSYLMGTAPVTLYAKWSANTYTVTLAPQGGSGGTGSLTATYDSVMPGGATPPALTGYIFNGYYSQINGAGTRYYDGTMESAADWDIAEDTTLYASWSAGTSTVTLESEGGNGGTGIVTATYDSPMPPATAPTRTGYAFTGYYSAPGGAGTQYYDSNMQSCRSWNITDDSVLFACWDAGGYNITLDQQGGTEGTGSVYAIYDSAMPPADAPVRAGYAFDGYYLQPDGNGTQYYNGAMVSVSNWNIEGDAQLYAHWIAGTFVVTLEADGGSGGTGSLTATYDSPMPAASAPSRDGYTFNGYYSVSGGGGTQYYDDGMQSVSNWNIEGPATLYAHWTACNYQVWFDKDGGSGGEDYVMVTYGEPMPVILSQLPEKQGYVFEGYFENLDGQGLRYYDGNLNPEGTWDIADNTYIYAHWSLCGYRVNLDKAGGTGGEDFVIATYGEPLPALSSQPEKQGYVFEGYFEHPDGQGRRYYDGNLNPEGTWDTAEDTVIYAFWTEQLYRLYFHLDGGYWPNGEPLVEVFYGQSLPNHNGNIPVLDGFIFYGFYQLPGGGGTHFYDENMNEMYHSWDIYQDQFAVACWEQGYEVRLLDFYNGNEEFITVAMGRPMPEVQSFPQKEHYAFNGYFSERFGLGMQYYDPAMKSVNNWDRPDGGELYPNYIPLDWNVTFNNDGGDSSWPGVWLDYSDEIPWVPVPTKPGYTFDGYYTLEHHPNGVEMVWDSAGFPVNQYWNYWDGEVSEVIAHWY